MKHHAERATTARGRQPAAERASTRGRLAEGPAGQRDVAQRERIESAFGTPAQREVDEEDELQMKAGSALQMQGLEEEEPLQGKTEPGATAGAAPAAEGGMPPGLRSGVEALSGMDLSDVQVHTGSPKPAEINALAYTQGNDIHVAPGQEQHLAHEAWHVVQQRQGRVQPTMQIGEVNVNDDAGLEAEADRMGAQAQQAGMR